MSRLIDSLLGARTGVAPVRLEDHLYCTAVPILSFVAMAHAAGLLNAEEMRAYQTLVAARTRLARAARPSNFITENYL